MFFFCSLFLFSVYCNGTFNLNVSSWIPFHFVLFMLLFSGWNFISTDRYTNITMHSYSWADEGLALKWICCVCEYWNRQSFIEYQYKPIHNYYILYKIAVDSSRKLNKNKSCQFVSTNSYVLHSYVHKHAKKRRRLNELMKKKTDLFFLFGVKP